MAADEGSSQDTLISFSKIFVIIVMQYGLNTLSHKKKHVTEMTPHGSFTGGPIVDTRYLTNNSEVPT